MHAEVRVHSKGIADRRKGRCANRVKGERVEPARMLSGHDESLYPGNDGAGENRRWGHVLRGAGKDRLFTAKYGGRRRVRADLAGVASGAGALAGWSGEGPPEAVGIV